MPEELSKLDAVFGWLPHNSIYRNAEDMALFLPREGGTFVQMEDEIAALGAVIGAVWAGMKGMTATSGPGFSLCKNILVMQL